MGRTLAARHAVTVATPYQPEIAEDRCTLGTYSYDRPDSLRSLAEQADVLVVQGFTLSQFPFLAELHIPIVVDLYCPFTIEHLEMMTSRSGVAAAFADASAARGDSEINIGAMEADAAGVLAVQNAQLALGDFLFARLSDSATSGPARCIPPAVSTRAPMRRTPRFDR
ncbi:MAG: hypothetical protein EXQ50_10880 [Acidobacteria bacterium]|nr:hypothetical protein [Acidobacteriota bacterium]